jgi:hypothetical protein
MRNKRLKYTAIVAAASPAGRNLMVHPSNPIYNEGNRVGMTSGATLTGQTRKGRRRGKPNSRDNRIGRPVGITEHSSQYAVLMRPQSTAVFMISRYVSLAMVVAAFAFLAMPAHALVVINTGTTDITVPPADDPGWANVAGGFSRNYVYLGNGWALTAAHVGPVAGDNDQLLNFNGTNFNMIPGQNFVVHNPTGQGLTTYTDLRLVRIDGDPGLPSLAIASTPLTNANLNQSVANLTIMGLGPGRQPNTSVWVDPNNNQSHTGYFGAGDYIKRWGKNQITDENPIFNESDSDLRSKITIFETAADVFANVDVISMFTIFDQAPSFEAQVIGGDSGSAVFHKNASNQWELIGIVNTALTFSASQPSDFAPFGGGTSFADLTFYRSEIMNIMAAHPTVLPGDYNSDGIVDGADYVIWRKGLGTTFGNTGYDVWRAHFGQTGSGAGAGSVTATGIVGSSTGGLAGVPEPATLILAIGAVSPLFLRRRRRGVRHD